MAAVTSRGTGSRAGARDDRPGDGAFDRYTGKGYVPPLEGDYGDARRKHHEVALLLFETLGGFSPETVQFLLRARDLQNNKLSSAQYRLTTWSARSSVAG